METIKITDEFIRENTDKRFNLTMADGKVLKKIRFFIAGSGSSCYMNSRQRRTGRWIPWTWNIVKIKEVKPKVFTSAGNAKKLLGRLHENCWDNLREDWKKIMNGGETSQDFRWHFEGKLNFRSMTKLIGKREQLLLEEAFKNKTEYTWYKKTYHHSGRDLSISTRICEDGIFRAWFSSEYMGCGNGDYYLLLSPKTAIYYERD